MTPFIYLDHNATTPVAPEVRDAMMPYLTEQFGNPSSMHAFGTRIERKIAEARKQVALLIGASDPYEVIFTSGGTESDNAALRGVIRAMSGGALGSGRLVKRHIVISSVEHAALYQTAELLETEGVEVSIIGADRAGRMDIEALRAALRPDTALVSVMWANNETGVIHPMAEITQICRERKVLLHTDAVQAVGKIAVSVAGVKNTAGKNVAENNLVSDDNDSVASIPVDLLSLSSHKINGPKGVGALYIRKGTPFASLIVGGEQEDERRGGTENVPGIVGFGKACELLRIQNENDQVRSDSNRSVLAKLRDRLEKGILATVPGTAVTAAESERVPNTSHIRFDGVEGEGIVLLLSDVGICASAGSACKAGSVDPSHTLKGMGYSDREALSGVRFSLGKGVTEADIDFTLQQLPPIVARLRGLPPLSGKPVEGLSKVKAG